MKTQVKHGHIHHIHHIDACAGSGTRRILQRVQVRAYLCLCLCLCLSSKVIWSFGKALSYLPQWPTFHLTSSLRPQQYQYHSAFERATSYCAAFTSPCELISLIIEQSAGAAVRRDTKALSQLQLFEKVQDLLCSSRLAFLFLALSSALNAWSKLLTNNRTPPLPSPPHPSPCPDWRVRLLYLVLSLPPSPLQPANCMFSVHPRQH